METKEQKSIRLTQAEVGYLPLSLEAGKACASCRWFSANSEYGANCRIIDNWPLDVLATGYCERWETLPSLEPVPPPSELAVETAIEAVMAVVDLVAAEASHDEDNHETTATPPAPSLVQRVKDAFNKTDTSPFQVFKADDGQHYWLARHTNIFEDRDKEILSSKAHTAYIARVNLGLVDMPELWAYHTKGTKHGQADLAWEHAGFVFALGHFDDTPEGKNAIKSYPKRKGKIELSHGFTYPSWALKDGVYTSYNTFEISTLPKGAASNPYTTFDEVTKMAMNDKQRAWIKDNLGEGALKHVEDAQSLAEKDADTLKALDKRYKDFAELETPTADDVKALEVSKTIGAVIGGIIGGMAELAEQQEAYKAEEATAVDSATKQADELTALKAEVAALKAQLDSRPRQASQDASTTIDPANLSTEIKKNMTQKDPLWGTDVMPTKTLT